MTTLTADTKIRLSQIKKYTQDKHSKYQPGDVAEWKDGLHQKTAHGWVKIPEEKDRNGNEVHRIKGIEKLSDAEFYNSDKSFLLPPIQTKAWKKQVKRPEKPLLLKRHVINRNTGKHKEFKGEDKNILHMALTKGNVVRYNKPQTKPNYFVIAKSGHYYYWATIDTDPGKKYDEIVDWRKVNEKNV